MSNGPKFGAPKRPWKPPIRLDAKPTRPHRMRKGELLNELRKKEARGGQS